MIFSNWLFFYFIPFSNERQLWPNYKSPLVWDATAIGVYLITSVIFWFSGIVPDFATLRANELSAGGAPFIRSSPWAGAGRTASGGG